MLTTHLTDGEIQLYVFAKEECAPHITDHMMQCDDCSARATLYRLMIDHVKQQVSPSFDFDLSASVMAKISSKPEPAWERFAVYIIALVLILLLAIPIYIYWGYFIEIFSRVSALLYYLIGVSALIILIFQIIDIYRRYQEKINSLNIYR